MQEITLPPSFFGSNKTTSSEQYGSDAYNVANSLCNIIMDEKGISEKSFSKVDEAFAEAKKIADKNSNMIKECIEKKQRIKYIAEQIYDLEFNLKTDKMDISGNQTKEIK